MSIICYGNRINQKFFKVFDLMTNKPCLTKGGVFLLFDYVHLRKKKFRNNWLTEASSKQILKQNEVTFTAKWSHLSQLYQLEQSKAATKNGVRGLSNLSKAAIQRKLIE